MRVLFIDTVHPSLSEALEAAEFECIDGTSWNTDRVNEYLPQADGVVIRSRITIDEAFLTKASSLKFIARSGAGLENIDLEATKRHRVKVFNSPEGNRDAVAEQAIGMLLALFNNMLRADVEVRQGLWKREENRGLELKGKTVGIIGYGVMGAAFAQRLTGFECNVLAFDKYKTGFGTDLVEEVSLEALKKEADIVSIHLPQTPETLGYVSAEFIASMGKPFFLINTARGKHVKTGDLILGMESGKVRGACLDVLEFEKKSFETLADSDLPQSFRKLTERANVVLSPHVAGWTHESYVKLSTFLAEKILKDFA